MQVVCKPWALICATNWCSYCSCWYSIFTYFLGLESITCDILKWFPRFSFYTILTANSLEYRCQFFFSFPPSILPAVILDWNYLLCLVSFFMGNLLEDSHPLWTFQHTLSITLPTCFRWFNYVSDKGFFFFFWKRKMQNANVTWLYFHWISDNLISTSSLTLCFSSSDVLPIIRQH